MDRQILELLAVGGKQADKTEEKQATFQEEADKIALTQQRIDIEKLKEEVESLKQDRKQRKILSYFVWLYVSLHGSSSSYCISMWIFRNVPK